MEIHSPSSVPTD